MSEVEPHFAVKKPLIAMMRAYFSDFAFERTRGNFYEFRRRHDDRLFDVISYQRDRFEGRGSIAVSLATTYIPEWRGVDVGFGSMTGLANVIQNSSMINAESAWYCYRSQTELHGCLDRIADDLRDYALPFFGQVAKELRSNSVLQFAIDENTRIGPVSDEEAKEVLGPRENGGHDGSNGLSQRYLRLSAAVQQFAAMHAANDEQRTLIKVIVAALIAYRITRMPRA